MNNAFSKVISWIIYLLANVSCTFVKRRWVDGTHRYFPKIYESKKFIIQLDHRSIIIEIKRKEANNGQRTKRSKRNP